MSQVWLLNLGAGCHAAVGERELVHLLYAPQSYPVPRAPVHTRVLPWQDRLLPVLDLAGWAAGEACTDNRQIAGVFAYQHKRGEVPQYGAIWLGSPPGRLAVDDAQACEMDESLQIWRELAMSGFTHAGAAVPILDLPRLYSSARA